MEPTKRISLQIAHEYYLWRASIPWTNEQIAAVLRELLEKKKGKNDLGMINMVSKGLEDLARRHLSNEVLQMVLPELVKKCGLCGDPAHYRIGIFGRCSHCSKIETPEEKLFQARESLRADARHAERQERARRKFSARRQIGLRG